MNMSRTIFINVDDKEDIRYNVEARSNDDAMIIVWAQSFEQAHEMLKQAMLESDVAVAEWKPQEVKPMKPIEKKEPEYNKRILKDLGDAEKFCDKHKYIGIGISYCRELAKFHPWDALHYCTCLGFRTGFNKAKKMYKEGRC